MPTYPDRSYRSSLKFHGHITLQQSPLIQCLYCLVRGYFPKKHDKAHRHRRHAEKGNPLSWAHRISPIWLMSVRIRLSCRQPMTINVRVTPIPNANKRNRRRENSPNKRPTVPPMVATAISKMALSNSVSYLILFFQLFSIRHVPSRSVLLFLNIA
jgi:hypothetical protein